MLPDCAKQLFSKSSKELSTNDDLELKQLKSLIKILKDILERIKRYYRLHVSADNKLQFRQNCGCIEDGCHTKKKVNGNFILIRIKWKIFI